MHLCVCANLVCLRAEKLTIVVFCVFGFVAISFRLQRYLPDGAYTFKRHHYTALPNSPPHIPIALLTPGMISTTTSTGYLFREGTTNPTAHPAIRRDCKTYKKQRLVQIRVVAHPYSPCRTIPELLSSIYSTATTTMRRERTPHHILRLRQHTR